MNLRTLPWTVGAILVLAVGVAILAVSSTLLPPAAEAHQKGTYVPWVITWGMVWTSVAMALAVAGTLFTTAFAKPSASHHVPAGRR